MKAEIRKIGNSRGIIVPKAILEQCELSDDVEMEVEEGALVIRPSFRTRHGWREAFRKVRREDDDPTLLDWQGIANQSDEEDLKW